MVLVRRCFVCVTILIITSQWTVFVMTLLRRGLSLDWLENEFMRAMEYAFQDCLEDEEDDT